MKRLLLTGASGFLGSHCLPEVLARGFEVHTVGRTPPLPGVAAIIHHDLDLLDTSRHESLMSAIRPTHLMHLAWTNKPGGGIYNATENYAWLSSSLNLALSFALAGGTRLVVCGSSAEYDWKHGYCTENLTPTTPDTAYGACKHALRIAIESLAKSRQLSWAWPRVFFCFGAREPAARLVPSVILSLLRNQPALCSHGNQIRDYLHVSDVAQALAQIVDSAVDGPINVSSGQATTLKELVLQIGALLDRTELVQLGAIAARSNDQPLVVGNNQRLQAEVGWQQRKSLNDGLRETISWWRERETAKAT